LNFVLKLKSINLFSILFIVSILTHLLEGSVHGLDELVGIEVMEIVKAVILGQADRLGEEFFDVLGDPAEAASVRGWVGARWEVPLEILEVEGVHDVYAPGEVCGFYIGFDTLVGAGGPRGGCELTSLVGTHVQLVLGGQETQREARGIDVRVCS
jgi:hypothetical protein